MVYLFLAVKVKYSVKMNWKSRMKNTKTTDRAVSICKLMMILSFLMLNNLAEASPKIEFIGMAALDVIEVVVQAGRVNVGRQVPYVKQDGDVIQESGHRR